ncbi:MAG: prepilin-type N-terminal cleavage/methylation domain-containing protein [Planctomycetota bacterium]|jgi:general secretion pathway protein G
MSTSTNQERQRGFTLVEIMVVVVIIGLLSALVGPEIFRMLGFGQASIAETKCKSLHDQAMIWKMINRKPPDSLDEMVAPLKQGDDANFLESVPEDPWGNPYSSSAKAARSASTPGATTARRAPRTTSCIPRGRGRPSCAPRGSRSSS